MKSIGKKSTDFTLLALLLIPVGVAINIVGFQLCQLLRLPIFLDSIGTILTGAIAGPWIGAITGLLTNMINGIFNPVYFPYAITSIIVGITAGVLGGRGMFTKIWKTLVSGLIIMLLATISSGTITAVLFSGATGSTASVVTATLLAAGQNIFQSVFTVQVIQELADKLISVLVVMFVIRGISTRYLFKLKYGDVYMKNRNRSNRSSQLEQDL